MAKHYLRSNDNYDHEFRLKRTGDDGLGIVWTLFGRSHQNKNVSIIENDEDYADIMQFEQIKQLKKRMVVTELENIPNNFYNAMELASKNAQLIQNNNIALQQKDNTISEKDIEIQRLKDKAKQAGIDLDKE
jgi:hypothetical protein